MKALLPFLCLSCVLTGTAAACDCGKSKSPAATTVTADATEPKTHPVKGVVMGLMPEKTALLVKHEEVPGVMRAMTMMFKVEPSVLEKVQKGDAISARMSRRADGWWLTEVEVIAEAK